MIWLPPRALCLCASLFGIQPARSFSAMFMALAAARRKLSAAPQNQHARSRLGSRSIGPRTTRSSPATLTLDGGGSEIFSTLTPARPSALQQLRVGLRAELGIHRECMDVEDRRLQQLDGRQHGSAGQVLAHFAGNA